MKGRHALSLKQHVQHSAKQAFGSSQRYVVDAERPHAPANTAPPDEALVVNQFERREGVFDALPVACITVDETGRVVDVNPHAEKIFGLQTPSLEGRKLELHIAVSDRNLLHTHLKHVFQNNTEITQTLKILNAAHEVVDVELRSIQLERPFGQRRTCVCALLDVSEKKRLEYEVRRHRMTLARTGRLSVIGEMAAGIAHEVNQPLAIILTYTRICLKMIATGQDQTDEVQEILGKVAAQASHAGAVIKRIRAFIRNDEPAPATVDINSVVNEALALVEPETRKHAIMVELIQDTSLPLVSADALQLEQVIVNLVNNAIEAINDSEMQGGVITVATHNDGGSRPVKITVADTGPGVCEGDEDMIFEPFFTTKPKGMGLGLSLSRSIVEVHGGRMWCEPNEEGGSRFHFILPAVEGGCNDRQYTDRIYSR